MTGSGKVYTVEEIRVFLGLLVQVSGVVYQHLYLTLGHPLNGFPGRIGRRVSLTLWVLGPNSDGGLVCFTEVCLRGPCSEPDGLQATQRFVCECKGLVRSEWVRIFRV